MKYAEQVRNVYGQAQMWKAIYRYIISTIGFKFMNVIYGTNPPSRTAREAEVIAVMYEVVNHDSFFGSGWISASIAMRSLLKHNCGQSFTIPLQSREIDLASRWLHSNGNLTAQSLSVASFPCLVRQGDNLRGHT